MLQSMATRSVAPLPYWKLPIVGRLLDDGDAASERLGRQMTALMNEMAGQGATVVEKLRQTQGDKLSTEEVVGNLTVLFAAGTDTTSVVLSWVFYHLARDQELQRVVAEEVREVQEPSPKEAVPGRIPSRLKEMPFGDF